MKAASDHTEVFGRLRAVLEPYAPQMLVTKDTDDTYYLDTPIVQKNKTPLFFASAQIKKSYVSFALFPVYVHPELLEGISPSLRKRMPGKSCFNFTAVDEPLFDELAQLVEAGHRRFSGSA